MVQRMKANENDFRFQNETIMQCKLQYIQQRLFGNIIPKQECQRAKLSKYSCSNWNLQKKPHEVFYKEAALSNFAIFTGKHLMACNYIKKRVQHKCFPVSIAKYLRTPILKIICERLLLHLFLIKARDPSAAAKLFIK